MSIEALFATSNLSIVSAATDAGLTPIRDAIEHHAVVGHRTDFEALLGRMLAASATVPRTPHTLDLIGHSTPTGLVALGSFVIDARNSIVMSYFRGLAEHDVLPRLGVHAIRLLGSLTADTDQGRATVCALADVLGVEVFGTRNLLFRSHFDRAGFIATGLLARASDIRHSASTAQPLLAGDPSARALDIDRLPAVSAAALGTTTSPRRWASRDEAQALLGLVKRNNGTTLPGLLAAPYCEVSLPAATDGAYHLVEVLLDGAYVRVDDGASGTVCYPVAAPGELLLLLDRLASVA